MEVKLLGNSDQKYIENQIQICAAAGKLSRMPGSVFDAVYSMNEPEKALKFVKRVIGMGHTSTIDHDYMVFALSGVSPLVEQTIIEERYSSFTIKSRREVDFSNVGFYVPDFHLEDGSLSPNNNLLKEKYTNYMKSLFENYSVLEKGGIPKEDARFILPYSYHSEIIMGLDGTSLNRMITNLTKTKYANIAELRELGEKLKEISNVRAPYIETLQVKENEKLNSEAYDLLYKIGVQKNYDCVESPILISHTNDIDKTIFVNAISRMFGKDVNEATQIYENELKNNDELKHRLMKALFSEVNNEDLRQVNFRFQSAIPFAILTHYTRHRRLSLSIPDFAPLVDLSKYEVPPKIQNSEFNDFYNEIYEKNILVKDEFKSFGIRDEDLVYFTLSGNKVNVIINFDGEAFRWICRLRECTKAQWCIRENITKMHQLVNEVSTYYSENLGPDCVTKHYCGEGKESCGRLKLILKKEKEK